LAELAFISLGSNIHPGSNLPQAVTRLGTIGRVVRVSAAYVNPAVGPRMQADFVNAAALVETSLSPIEIRTRLRQIETELGRVRDTDKYAARTIDLDLCLLGDRVESYPDWALPDPDIDRLAHLAIPLAEVDPSFRHPLTGETLRTIAERLRPSARLTPNPAISLWPPAGLSTAPEEVADSRQP